MRRLFAVGVSALVWAAAAAAAQPHQQVVLPGPVPYLTPNPPLIGTTALPQVYMTVRLHVASDQRVLVGVDGEGRPVQVSDRQRLIVRGKGDYQLAIGGPIRDVHPAAGTQSSPGLRTDQLLWAGFSPGRKVLAADVIVRTEVAAKYLPLRLRLKRDGGRAILTVANATQTPQRLYAGTVRLPELGRLLDETRRASLAGVRLTGTYATFIGSVRTNRLVTISAPLRVQGELRLPGQAPVRFDRILGDGRPESFQVSVRGSGTPAVHLEAKPAAVVRLLRPPGASSWAEAVRRRPLSPADLLERLMTTRMQLVRADQFQSFLSDPDADGKSRTVYEFRTVAVRPHPAATATHTGGGSDVLLIVLLVVGSLALAGGGLVVWAHS